MTVRDDPRVAEAKTIPMRDVIDRLGIAGLNRMGNELIGPCPLCGGRDRFGVNLQSKAFLCRKCDLRGGDQIALAMQVQGVDFRAALQFLCGDAPAHIDPVEMERRRKRAAESERKQKALQEKYRRKQPVIVTVRKDPETDTVIRHHTITPRLLGFRRYKHA